MENLTENMTRLVTSVSIALQGEVGPPGRQGIKGDAGEKVSKHQIWYKSSILIVSVE